MKRHVLLLALVAVLAVCLNAQGAIPTPNDYVLDGDATVSTVGIRSGDPCGKLVEWGDGIVLPELKNGKAEHDLFPAMAFVLSSQENEMNVVSMLAISEISQNLMSVGKSWNRDFEYRLLEIMNYGSDQTDRYRWYGFVPQLVGTSYQFFLEEERGLTFQEALAKFTGNPKIWPRFRLLYSHYAWLMNYYLGTRNPLMPGSNGYYNHFQATTKNRERFVAATQKFLEAMNSPLKDKELFQKPGYPSIVNYDATWKFCE